MYYFQKSDKNPLNMKDRSKQPYYKQREIYFFLFTGNEVKYGLSVLQNPKLEKHHIITSFIIQNKY